MPYFRIIMHHFPSLKIMSICTSVLFLMVLTWEPHNKYQNGSKLTNLKKTRKCLEYPLELEGSMPLNMEQTPDLDILARYDFTEVEAGGRWSPSRCQDPASVAVIIPFREDLYGDRSKSLRYLVMQLHYIMQRQMLKYVIVVAEQNGTEGYINKGLLMNLGYLHITTENHYKCVVFNDADMIPVDDRNNHGCDLHGPKHMATYVNDKIVTYEKATGGVLSMATEVFGFLNGFSNRIWGWNSDDDDMYERLTSEGYSLTRVDPGLGQYLHLHHRHSIHNSTYKSVRYESYKKDGLNSISKTGVKLLQIQHLPLYTLISYVIPQPNSTANTISKH